MPDPSTLPKLATQMTPADLVKRANDTLSLLMLVRFAALTGCRYRHAESDPDDIRPSSTR